MRRVVPAVVTGSERFSPPSVCAARRNALNLELFVGVLATERVFGWRHADRSGVVHSAPPRECIGIRRVIALAALITSLSGFENRLALAGPAAAERKLL